MLPSIRDVFFLLGLGLLAYGFHTWWQPGAFIVPGAILVSVAILSFASELLGGDD